MKPLPAPPAALTPEGDERTPAVRWIVASLALSMLMPSLDTSIANAGLPTLAKAFTASFQAVQWIVLAYLLAITALIVSVGRLGDVLGPHRLLLVGIGLFTGASLLCGLAPTLGLLIAARSAQGLGAAIMMALALALVSGSVPKERIGGAMGLLGTMSAIGTTLGPSIGGFLTAWLGWRSIFLVNVPLGVLNLWLARRHLPLDRPQAPSIPNRFDALGTLLLALALGAYALAMTMGHGSFGRFNLALLAAAALGAGAFLFAESRVTAPLIRLGMFRHPVLSTGLLMNGLVSTVMMSTLVVGPFYLSGALGLRTALVGLVISIGPALSMLAGIPAGRMVDRWGAPTMVRVGLIGMATGAAALTVLPGAFGLTGYIAAILILTPGYQLFQASNITVVMMDAHPEQRGVLSGLLSLSRNLGLITGASLMGAVFALASAATDMAKASPSAVAAGMRTTFATATILMIAALILALGAQAKVMHRGTPARN